MKSAGFQWAALYKFDGNTGTAAWFDLTNGVLGTVASGVTASIENAGGGWWKCSITQQHVSTNYLYIHIYPTNGNNSIAATPSGTNGIYIWGANINLGSTAKPYQPTTDRLNYPRITYQNGRGAILNEPAKTNLVLYSQQFDASGWVNYQGATVTPSASISPDGTQNAYSLNVTTTGYSGLYRSVSGGTNIGTVSGFFKKGTIDWVLLVNTNGTDGVAWFNLANGTIGTVDAGYSATIEPFKDGWYRCSVTNPSLAIGIWQVGGATSDNNPTPAYAGNIYIWGAQVETGRFASSYIPTTSATVTRPMDQFSKNNMSFLGSNDWTFYMSGELTTVRSGSGGNISYYGPYTIHTFTGSATFTPSFNGEVEVLVVAGGGGGGGRPCWWWWCWRFTLCFFIWCCPRYRNYSYCWCWWCFPVW
jgi:hypothetical protein